MKTSKKYNNKEIMRRTFGLTMGEAMKAAWSEAKAAAGASEYDSTAQEYFDALKELDKAQQRLDAIKAKMQDACLQSPDFCISGFGWNASFKEVNSSPSAPAIANRVVSVQDTARFLFFPVFSQLRTCTKNKLPGFRLDFAV